MEEEYLTLDEKYLEAYNIGYKLSKETGLKVDTLDKLKPEQLKKMNIDKSRLDVIKQGMKQQVRDKKHQREKEIKLEKKKLKQEQSKNKGLNR